MLCVSVSDKSLKLSKCQWCFYILRCHFINFYV